MSDDTESPEELALTKRLALMNRPPATWTDAELVAEVTERYAPTSVPPCPICGRKLTLGAIGGGMPHEWACYRDADGRMNPQEHITASRFTDPRHGGDSAVMEASARFAEVLGHATVLAEWFSFSPLTRENPSRAQRARVSAQAILARDGRQAPLIDAIVARADAAERLAAAWERLYRARDAYHHHSFKAEWDAYEAALRALVDAGGPDLRAEKEQTVRDEG